MIQNIIIANIDRLDRLSRAITAWKISSRRKQALRLSVDLDLRANSYIAFAHDLRYEAKLQRLIAAGDDD